MLKRWWVWLVIIAVVVGAVYFAGGSAGLERLQPRVGPAGLPGES